MSTPYGCRHRLQDLVQRRLGLVRLSCITGIVVIGAGCATEEVLLRHPETQEIVKCGPFAAPTAADRVAAVKRTRDCVEDYERQGYKRLL